jgi:hypothetical protein
MQKNRNLDEICIRMATECHIDKKDEDNLEDL